LLRPLQIGWQGAGALEILKIPRLAELLAQGRVLELSRSAVRSIELPMILPSHEIGAVEAIVIDHIDGDRAAAAPTAIVTPVIVAPQRGADEEADAEPDHRGADHVSGGIPVERPIGGPQPRTVGHVRIIDRHVIDARIDRLDHDVFGWRRWWQQ